MAETTKIDIRRGTVYDLFACELLLAKGLEESKGLLPDYDQLAFFHKSLNLLDSGCVFVARELVDDKRERIVGCLALNPEEFSWNSSAKVLRSVHYYVLPAYRPRTLEDGKTLVAEALRDAGCALADLSGMPLIIEQLHQVGPDNRAAAKDRMFERAGMSYVGGNYVYLPQRAEAAAEQEQAA